MDIFEKIPAFDGKYAGSFDCRENCLMKLFINTTAEDFCGYVSSLEADGFKLLQQTDTEDNLFAVLKKDCVVTVYFTPCDGFTRITASEKNQTPCFEKTECAGECQTTFYGFESDHTIIDCGMCLLVQCPDYSFFIVDSGHYFQFNDNDRIYKLMRERTPKGRKVVVNGWMITHAHTDHISKLMDFLKYNTDDVVIEGFYQNLIREDCYVDDNHEETEMAAKLFRMLEAYPAPVYKLHTGMRFYIRNLTFDVLSTQEDLYPDEITDYNDSSCVVMLEAEGTKIFIPGDAAVLAGRKMEQRFSEKTFKCDVVQIAHHGHTGLSTTCYEKLNADVAVFPVTQIMFDADYQRMAPNRRAIELAKEYYVTSNGTVVIPLPYKEDTVTTLPDETFEDFEKIKRIWRYVYTDEYKEALYENFVANGGELDNTVLPTSAMGWIEPKPPIEE